jgi:hypothetical protein
MRDLGNFGSVRPANEGTFSYFGTTVRVHPDLTDLALIDLATKMLAAESTKDGQEAIRMVADVAGMIVHPDDADEFWRSARANRQTMQDVIGLAAELIGALAERPTVLPSDSSGGQPTTGTSSTDGSSSQALRLLEGRPDLQVAVLRSEQARQAG